MKLLFYDAEGKLFRAVDNVTTGYEGAFPKGEYSIVAHNEDMVNADWRNRDDLGTAETFALPKEFEFDHRPSQLQCVSVPSSVYVANEFQESGKLTVSDIDNVSLTVVPVDRLHHLKLRFHVSVPGKERIESLGGVLGGVSGSWIASTGSHEPTIAMAHEFKASEGVVDPIAQRNIFSTNPTTEGTNYARNFFCEAICTFVFISAILAAASRAGENVLMLAICVGLIVWAVGMGMGGITGFAMNQARDLGPRMAYQVLPIKNKADNNWKYGLLVPGIAPFVGAALAALFVHGFLGMF